jgi:hypothetical protein
LCEDSAAPSGGGAVAGELRDAAKWGVGVGLALLFVLLLLLLATAS